MTKEEEFEIVFKEAFQDMLIYGTMVLTTDSNGSVKRLNPTEVLKDFPEIEESCQDCTEPEDTCEGCIYD